MRYRTLFAFLRRLRPEVESICRRHCVGPKPVGSGRRPKEAGMIVRVATVSTETVSSHPPPGGGLKETRSGVSFLPSAGCGCCSAHETVRISAVSQEPAVSGGWLCRGLNRVAQPDLHWVRQNAFPVLKIPPPQVTILKLFPYSLGVFRKSVYLCRLR